MLIFAFSVVAEPAHTSVVGAMGSDMSSDVMLVKVLGNNIGENLTVDLALLGDSFIDGVNNFGNSLALAGNSFIDGAHSFGANLALVGGSFSSSARIIGEGLAMAGDSFFDGADLFGGTLALVGESFSSGGRLFGSNLVLAGNYFFDGVHGVGNGLALVGEKIDGAIFGDASLSRQSPPRLAAQSPVLIPAVSLPPVEPVALEPKPAPLSAVAGLKVVANNLILNDAVPATEPELTNVNFYLGAGAAHVANKNYALAQAEFAKALSLDPSTLSTYIKLASAYELSGNLDEAIAVLERGMERGGRGNVNYLLEVGRLYFNRHTPDDLVVAERAFQEVLIINPSSRDAIFSLGAIAGARDAIR